MKSGATKQDLNRIASLYKSGENFEVIGRTVQVYPEVVEKIVKSFKMEGPPKKPAAEAFKEVANKE